MKQRVFKDTEFGGINNKAGLVRQRTHNIVSCMNVELTDDREVRTRKGFVEVLSKPGIVSAYFTRNQKDLYVIAGDELIRIDSNMQETVIETGVDGSEVYWSELGNRISLSGTTVGVIRRETNTLIRYPLNRAPQPIVRKVGGVLPEGSYSLVVTQTFHGEESPPSSVINTTVTQGQGIRVELADNEAEYSSVYVTRAGGSSFYLVDTVVRDGALEIRTPPSDSWILPVELTQASNGPTLSGPNTFFMSRWVASYYDDSTDMSYIYFSQPFSYGLFDVVRGYLPLPGRVTMLCGTQTGMLIGTDGGLFLAPDLESLTQVTSVAVAKTPAPLVDEQGMVWFWTSNGLARGLPYEDVTIDRLDPQDSTQVTLGLVKDPRGDKIIIVTKE